MYYVYVIHVIQCDEGKYYIGSTSDVKKRIREHNAGLSKWTSRYNNWKLVHLEQFTTRREALIRERFIKKQKRGDVFYQILGKVRDKGR